MKIQVPSLVPMVIAVFLVGCSGGNDLPDVPDIGVEDAESDVLDAQAGGPFLFRQMTLTLLDNLVDNAAAPDGDWLHTETHDALGLAPRVLFEFSKELDRPELADAAMLTIDYYYALAMDVAQRIAAGEAVDYEAMSKMMGGALSLVDAYIHTEDTLYRDFLSILLLIVGQEILDDPTLIGPGGMYSIYNPLFSGGAIVSLNVELALAIKSVEGDFTVVAEGHLNLAADLLTLLDMYRTPACFYDSHLGTEPDATENMNMLMALATMYVATGEQEYLGSAVTLVDALQPLWDDDAGAYRQREASNYIGLAENVVILYGEMLLYERMADPAILDRVVRFFQFAETELYAELPVVGDEGGYRVILHDNQGLVHDWYWCSGCNLFALHNIVMLNRLLGNQLLAQQP